MKTRMSEPFRRTVHPQRGGTPWLGAGTALAFAAAPLVVMLWVVPVTGIGIA